MAGSMPMDDVMQTIANADPATLAVLANESLSDFQSDPKSCLTAGVLFGFYNATTHRDNHTVLMDVSDEEFELSLYAASAFMATVLLASFIFHLFWLQRTERKEERYKRAEELDRLVDDLVMHFAPLVAVDGYQFKGMKSKSCGVRLDFEDLGLTLKSDGRSVLKGVTGSFEKGKMAAIMGPSGSGKTTFMNTLCGKAYYGNVLGDVKVNGESGNFADLKLEMGFVPQDDVVHESLTVREQVEFSAKLRNDRSTTRPEICDIVEDVLQVLQIGHIQRSIVGGVERRGISGGQRKRVNIGLELAACPVLLFLDEPTSGLDSTSSLMIVNALKKMTELGMTIIMVIHQPRYSLYTLFDQVLLLGTGGRTVYLGSPARAISYFEGFGFQRPREDNPADWLMDVISGEVECSGVPDFRREQLFDFWTHHSQTSAMVSPRLNMAEMRLRRGRSLAQNSYEMIKGMMSHYWEMCDPHGTGTLSSREVSSFVTMCLDRQVDPDIVEELMLEIGDSSSSAQHEAMITKSDFDSFVKVRFERLVKRHVALGDTVTWPAMDDPTQELEPRTLPGVGHQFVIMSHRRLVQFWRDWVRRLLDVVLICVCALCFAVMNRGQEGSPVEISMCHMGVSLLIGVSVLPTFADRPILWRETSTGVSIVALYMARICMSLIDAVDLTILYALVYWLALGPPVAFHIYLFPLLCLGWAIASWGYLFSVVVPPRNAILVTLVVSLILTQVVGKFDIITDTIDSPTRHLIKISPTRWSVPMQFIAYVDSEGGPIDGIRYPNPPDCSDLAPDYSSCENVDAGRVVPCAGKTGGGADECIVNEKSACERRKDSQADSSRAKRMLTFLKIKSEKDYCRWAYNLLQRHATWIHDGAALILQGLILHLIGFLCLLQQSPTAQRFKEHTGRSIRACFQFPLFVGGDDSEGESSEDGFS